jgi:hypothetical protein
MLSVQYFFTVCVGNWQTNQMYHFSQKGKVERSHYESNAEPLTSVKKYQISSSFISREFFKVLLLGCGLKRSEV